MISQLGPASDQRAAFISQGSGQPPAPGALRPSPSSQNIPAVGKSQQDGAFRMPQPPGRCHSPGPCPGGTCCRAHAGSWMCRERRGCVWCPQGHPAPLSHISIPVRNASSHLEHPTETAETCFVLPAREVFLFSAVAVSVFPCGGGCPHACARCADSLTH